VADSLEPSRASDGTVPQTLISNRREWLRTQPFPFFGFRVLVGARLQLFDCGHVRADVTPERVVGEGLLSYELGKSVVGNSAVRFFAGLRA
jgi:hypothetical protein